MHRLKTLGLITFMLLVSACASNGPGKDNAPDWIDGASQKYPSSRYLLGRGQSEYRALAQDRARADLSKIFEVRLREQSQDTVSFKSSQDASQQTRSLERQSERRIQSQTDQVVSGIQIAEIWRDPKNGQFHALAVLDRLQMSMHLRQAISQQDSATAHEIALAKQQADLLVKISHASRALRIQQRRAQNQALLKVLDPAGTGSPPRYNLEKLRTDRDQLLARLRISSHVSEDPIGGLDTLVEGALANAGFRNSPDQQADYLLDSQLQIEGFPTADGWYWYRGNLQISLRDSRTGNSAGQHRWPLKVSSRSQENARQRLRDEINRILSSQLRNTLIQLGLPDE